VILRIQPHVNQVIYAPFLYNWRIDMDKSTAINPNTKWFILALSAITATIASSAPSASLSVLFKEISTDLRLDLVQVGLVWSIGALPAILTSFLGGAIIDRFGPKKMLIISLALLALTGASRGLAGGFATLLGSILLMGAVAPMATMSAYKVNGTWFPARQLGMANGVFSMGMALGFMLGSFISATLLSPWLGGWRPVMFFYGGLTLLLLIPWWFYPSAAPQNSSPENQAPRVSLRGAFTQVLKVRNLWLLGFSLFGYSGAIQGILGYLPLYLRDLGWAPIQADGAPTLFHAMSMAFVMPITLFSDRMRNRRGWLLVTLSLAVCGAAGLVFAKDWLVWVSVFLMGLGRDATMALLLTFAMEMEGVGPRLAGTAIGFVTLFSYIGALISSPIGNSLAGGGAALPFAFWAGLLAFGLVCVGLIRKR